MRRILREATQNDHELIDQAMAKLDLTDRVGYRVFLDIHYEALSALEGRWSARDQPDFSGLLSCLVNDLQALNSPVDRTAAPRKARAKPLCQLGLAYVIRGSRLGGAILRQRVPAEHPTSYLDYTPHLTWPEFLKQLEYQAQALNSQGHAQIIRGAKQAFAAFSAAAATHLTSQLRT
jgi:heme oxygenase